MKLKKKFEKHKKSRLSDLFLENYPPKSNYAESYRSLRTGIQFSFLDEEFRSILITSAGAEEGKTASTANLAYTIAQAGKTKIFFTHLNHSNLALDPEGDARKIIEKNAFALAEDGMEFPL